MQASTVLTERTKIYEQVEKIRCSSAAAEQELKAANKGYGAAIAAHQLGECAELNVDETRARVEQARIEVDGFAAARAVLSARVLSSDAELSGVNKQLQDEIRTLVNARHEELEVEFAAAVDGVAEVLRRMAMVASAAGTFGKPIDRALFEVVLTGTDGRNVIDRGRKGSQRISELAGAKGDEQLVKKLRPLVELWERVESATQSVERKQQNGNAE